MVAKVAKRDVNMPAGEVKDSAKYLINELAKVMKIKLKNGTKNNKQNLNNNDVFFIIRWLPLKFKSNNKTKYAKRF